MENKIVMSELAAMLALSTGTQKDLCENFLCEFFSLVEEELTKGENVRIKGFGTFKLMEVEPRKSVNVATGEENEIPGHNKVIFVMAKELAALVNAPFDAFEAVEIADGLANDLFEGEVEAADIVRGEEVSREEEVSTGDDEMQSIEESETNEKLESEFVASEMAEDLCDTEPSVGAMENSLDVEEDNSDKGKDNSVWKRYKFIIGFLAGICFSVLIGWIIFVSIDYFNKPSENQKKSEVMRGVAEAEKMTQDNNNLKDSTGHVEEVASEHNVATESLTTDEVATQPSDSPVYDTVTTTRYLTTIAKEHYGNFNLWPIIYEANAAILGHPNRIRPGTKVVVPPLAKYNINPNNPEHIEAMKQRGKEIYRKFQ